MMEDSDAALVSRAREGDQDAARALVERHSARLFQLAYRMTGNEHDAEDIVQESLLKAFRSLGRYDNRAEFGAWLRRITSNCAIDHIRKRQRQRTTSMAGHAGEDDLQMEIASGELAPDHRALNAETFATVERAMGALSETERAAFVLRHFEGRSIGDIGRLLGSGESATKQSVFRAVQKMRKALEPLMNARV
jgi:RNA polymerase sigma-70 factor (ECF subfamily)